MKVHVRIQGVDRQVSAQIIKGTLWVHHEGRTFAVESEAGSKSRRKGNKAGASDQVIAPMPGKVTKIFVTPGTEVAVGQAVLVMEAMKMEYTLKAEVAGAIEKISCAVGEQVVLGKVLVKIATAADKK
ncbi:MAG: biotin/lipoyl-containing protein [Bdellovibrio sp.]